MSKKFETIDELMEFSNKIINQKVSDLFSDEQIEKSPGSNKGKLGHLVEKHFYGYDLNSDRNPDFDELGVELKVTPIKELVRGGYSPKERLKLTQLNIDDVIDNEDIRESSTWNKIRQLLIIWYVYSPEFRDNKFQLVKLFKAEDDDSFEQIQDDWTKIRKMLIEGRAHEISESQTVYLGLARNGSGGNERKIPQPNSEELFYRRAFTFKPNFMKTLLVEAKENAKNRDYIDYLRGEIIGKTPREILGDDYFSGKVQKDIASFAAMKSVGFKKPQALTDWYLEEYGEYVTFKTVPVVRKKDGTLKIDQHFKINVPISSEETISVEWIDSRFSTIFENKFVAIIYEKDTNNLENSKYIDLKVFEFDDKEIKPVIDGYNDFRSKMKNGGILNPDGGLNLAKVSDKTGMHFRPWAINGKDKFITAAGEELQKIGLWVNGDVIYEIIFGETED